MSREIVVHDEALFDVIDHAYYLAEESMEISERFRSAMRETVEQLALMPGMGSRREYRNPRLAGMRMWPVSGFRSYLIFYIPTEEKIDILRVLHGAQDIESVFAPEDTFSSGEEDQGSR